MGRGTVEIDPSETAQVGGLRAGFVIDALSSITQRLRDGLRPGPRKPHRSPRHLRKRERPEKRPAAAEKVKPQAGGHAVAPEAPNYVEPGPTDTLLHHDQPRDHLGNQPMRQRPRGPQRLPFRPPSQPGAHGDALRKDHGDVDRPRRVIRTDVAHLASYPSSTRPLEDRDVPAPPRRAPR